MIITNFHGDWIVGTRAAFTTVSPDRESVYSFDLEGRPISWWERDVTFKRSLASRVFGRRRERGTRLRWEISGDEALDRFRAIRDRIAAVPLESFGPTVGARVEAILRWTPEALLAERDRFEAAYRPISILPPDQYLAIVLQASHGCTWNRCTFCSFYQDRPFEARDGEEFSEHVRAVDALLGRGADLRKRIFLADGNALVLSNDRLRPVFETARGAFGDRPFYGFVDVFSGRNKPEDDWRELARLGLAGVHVGLESGHDPLLAWVRKPGTSGEASDFIATLKAAGLAVSVILMAGAGGDRFAEAHVRDTLDVVGRLPLDAGDVVYLSPFVEHGESEYARLAREEGVSPLPPDDIERQYATLRDGLRAALPAAQVSRYDIREFVY